MAKLTSEEIYKRVDLVAKPLLKAANVDLIELNIAFYQGDVLIQITADKPAGGITIEECSVLNKKIVHAIEEIGFLPLDGFALEFSSPGLDRPLRAYKDFLRCLDCEIHFWLTEAVEGKKEVEGVLIGVNERALMVYTKKNHELVLPLEIVEKGLLVI